LEEDEEIEEVEEEEESVSDNLESESSSNEIDNDSNSNSNDNNNDDNNNTTMVENVLNSKIESISNDIENENVGLRQRKKKQSFDDTSNVSTSTSTTTTTIIEKKSTKSNNIGKTKKMEKVLESGYSFRVDSASLNANSELRKKFGSATVDNFQRENVRRTAISQIFENHINANVSTTNRQRTATRNALLRKKWYYCKNDRKNIVVYKFHSCSKMVAVKSEWPRVETDISMTLEGSSDADRCAEFRMRWSDAYRERQATFFQCVATNDPMAVAVILRQEPYHIDALVRLSDVCVKSNDLPTAVDLLERVVYVFESRLHADFRLDGSCRLPYRFEENRALFLALFRYVQLLGRQGCFVTALEYCKLLLSFDPTDPMV
jgi:hypothetical protein